MHCSQNSRIRVLIADGHPVTRIGLRSVLGVAPGIEVVGEASHESEVRVLVSQLHPDILLLDLIVMGSGAIDGDSWIRDSYPETRTVILTATADPCLIAKAIEAGTLGYLMKSEDPDVIVSAVRRAAAGEVLFSPDQIRCAHRWFLEIGNRLESLTDQERRVLGLLAEGRSNSAIATELGVSANTVRCHCGRIYRKLKTPDRTSAVVFYLARGTS